MRRLLTLLAAAGMLALCVSTVAMAQPGRGGFGMRGGFRNNLLYLAMNEAVQKEIEVVDDQKAEIEKIGEEIRSQRPQGERPNFREMSEEEREKYIAQMRERGAKEAKIANARLEEALLPHQMKRIKEISLQQRGVAALSDDEVAKELKITDAQKKKLEDVNQKNMETMRSKMEELRQGGSREGFFEKYQEMRKEAEGKVLAVLTGDQKKKFEEMKGEPFEMPQRTFTRGGRRGGGERGEGGGRGRPQRPASDN